MSARIDWIRLGTGIAIAAVIGYFAVVGPAISYPTAQGKDAAFSPLVYRAVRELHPLSTLPLLIFAGLFATLVTRQRHVLHAAIVGLATSISLPIWSILDMVLGDPNIERHSLLPIEWLIYAGLSSFGVLGAFLAMLLLRLGRRRSSDSA